MIVTTKYIATITYDRIRSNTVAIDTYTITWYIMH